MSKNDPSELKHLTHDPRNARKHGKRNLDAISSSLKEAGAGRSILIDENGTILAGNGVVQAAKDAGITKLRIVETAGDEIVAVRRTGLTQEQKTRLALADNRTAELATWDTDELARLKETDPAILDGLFTDKELAALLAEAGETGDATKPPSAKEDKAAELQKKWKTELGQLWEIPSKTFIGHEHRIICGDATSKDTFARLFAGSRKANCVYTDPPYGLSYKSSSGKHAAIKNDALQRNALSQFLTESLKRMVENSTDKAAFYVWHASPTREDFFTALKAAGIVEKQYIIWVKPSLVLGHADYQLMHEPAFYGCKDGQQPNFYGDRAQTTVWRIANTAGNGGLVTSIGTGLLVSQGQADSLYLAPQTPKGKKTRHIRLDQGETVTVAANDFCGTVWEVKRDTADPLHPTQNPVELAAVAIRNSTEAGDIVMDSFSGGAATMVAAEQLARISRTSEIDPRYVAIALERLEELGLTPRLMK